MLNVGLTGGIASGKSTVAKMFQERGAYLIDFDELAHFVEEPDQACMEGYCGLFWIGHTKRGPDNKQG